MKKALIIANMMFASATVFGMEPNNSNEDWRAIRQQRMSQLHGQPQNMENSQILQKSSERTQRFVAALRSGDVKQVEQSIKDGADVNNTIVNGTTPLIFAVNANNYDLVDTLIREGADVNVGDSYYKTALSLAVDFDNERMVRLLVKEGKADIYRNGVFDRVMRGSGEIRDFLEHINVSRLLKSVRSNDVSGVKKVLNDKIRINGKDDNGYTPLMYAAASGNLEIIELLMDRGARADVVSKKPAEHNMYDKESFGDNALFFAVRNGHTEVLNVLLSNLVKEAVYTSNIKNLEKNIAKNIFSVLDHKNNLGQTLLVSALKNGREDTTIWLIDHGADVNGTFFDTEYEWGRDYFSNIKDEPVAYKRSPLAIAEQHNLTRAVEKLKEKGAISINMRLPDKIRKAADRKYKRKYASDDCESAIEAAFRMYDEAEAQFPENIRRARRAEAEANYEGALKSVSGIYKSEERKGRRVGAEAGYENILRSVSRMYYAATAQSQATAEYRRVRRARAGSDYEDALKSVFSMYKSEEEHIISADEVMRRADIRARRAEARARAEANGDSSLIAACQMILRGKIVAPRQRVVAPMWRVPARRFVFLLICSK